LKKFAEVNSGGLHSLRVTHLHPFFVSHKRVDSDFARIVSGIYLDVEVEANRLADRSSSIKFRQNIIEVLPFCRGVSPKCRRITRHVTNVGYSVF